MAEQLALNLAPARAPRVVIGRRSCWHPDPASGNKIRWRHWGMCAWCSGTGNYRETYAHCPCGELAGSSETDGESHA